MVYDSNSHYQYFTKRLRSCDFSHFLAERLKSLLRFRDLLIMKNLYPQIAQIFSFQSAKSVDEKNHTENCWVYELDAWTRKRYDVVTKVTT